MLLFITQHDRFDVNTKIRVNGYKDIFKIVEVLYCQPLIVKYDDARRWVERKGYYWYVIENVLNQQKLYIDNSHLEDIL